MRVRGSSYACRSGDNFAKSLIFLKIFRRVAREFICVECGRFSTAYPHGYPQARGSSYACHPRAPRELLCVSGHLFREFLCVVLWRFRTKAPC